MVVLLFLVHLFYVLYSNRLVCNGVKTYTLSICVHMNCLHHLDMIDETPRDILDTQITWLKLLMFFVTYLLLFAAIQGHTALVLLKYFSVAKKVFGQTWNMNIIIIYFPYISNWKERNGTGLCAKARKGKEKQAK